MESTKTPIIFKEAIIPNSIKILFCVTINVAKPSAVVKFVKKVAFPTLLIIIYNAFILFPCRLYSL